MRILLAAILRASSLFVVVGVGMLAAGLVLLLIALLRLATGEPPA